MTDNFLNWYCSTLKQDRLQRFMLIASLGGNPMLS